MNMLDTLKGPISLRSCPKAGTLPRFRHAYPMTLRHGPTKAIASSRIPTMPGKLFLMEELAGPLCPDTN